MRILFIAAHVDRPEAHMIAGLVRSGYTIDVIVRPERRFVDIMEAAGAHVHVREWSRAFWSPSRKSLRDLMGEIQPDIVHALDNTALYDTWRARGNLSPVWIAYRGASHLSWRSKQLYRRCGVARIACVCGSVKAAMEREGCLPQKLTVIYKGHDPAWYQPAGRARLQQLGVPPGARLIGAVARWREMKNGPVLVDAFRRLRAGDDVYLLMVGEVIDPKLERMRRDMSPADRILFVGHQPDAAGLLGACDVAVLPSNEQEGLSKVVLEAMAQGVPVIAGRGGGSSEILRDGVEGLFVDPGNADQLAAALKTLLSDEPFRRSCAARARERMETAFSIQATINNYRALYSELTARH